MVFFGFCLFIYKLKTMRRVEQKKKNFSITIIKELNNLIEEDTCNKSRLIEYLLYQYYKNVGEDISKIKL